MAIALAACGGGGDDDGGGDPIASALRADGTAEATAPGTDDRVECVWFADITGVTETADGWTGEATGEVFRRSFRGDQPLFEFQALTAGPVFLVEVDDGVEVRLSGDQPDDAMPFWQELEVLAGAADGASSYAGSWTCAPILPGDPTTEDLELDAAGTWTIVPAG